ncbi:TM0106 family RecB-like putative nuclease [Nakamurella endophytica]|nr:TM0106 family RecB-like putative nuclease [Nakamurella endophytica]
MQADTVAQLGAEVAAAGSVPVQVPAAVLVGGSAREARPPRLGAVAAARCRRRVHLDADPTAPRERQLPADDGVRQRWADAAEHRNRILAGVLAQPGAVAGADWDPGDPGDRPAVVVRPQLSSATRDGSPDLLLRATDGGYLPVLVRNHRTTDAGSGARLSAVASMAAAAVAAAAGSSGADPVEPGRFEHTGRRMRSHPEDALALAHHVRLLQELGLATALPAGGVIGRGPGTDESPHEDAGYVLWHELSASGVLAEYDSRFADRLAVAATAATGAAALAEPSRIAECRRCPWWPVCESQLVALRDVSLLVSGTDVSALRTAGVRTVDELAQAPAELLGSLPLSNGLAGTARVRAKAWISGAQLVRRGASASVPRADLELDVDMESYLDDGAYLWGTYLSGPAVQRLGLRPGYRPFVTWRPLPDRDEGRAFAEFWAYLQGIRSAAAAHGLTFAAYCYSRQAEERWLRSAPRRFPDQPGMPPAAEIDAFCSGGQWVDIYQEIRDQFVVPGSMKLKVLAPLTGFGWRDREPGGENSMAWYRVAVGAAGSLGTDGTDGMNGTAGTGSTAHAGAGPVEPVDAAMARRILQYNEDDVRATLALRRWITERSWSVPSAADLDGPAAAGLQQYGPAAAAVPAAAGR